MAVSYYIVEDNIPLYWEIDEGLLKEQFKENLLMKCHHNT